MAFDFTPPFTHGPMSDNNSNEEIIEALNNEYNNNADEWNERLPWYLKPNNTPQPGSGPGIWPAWFTYFTWFKRQFGPDPVGPGESEANPYEVPFTPQQKKEILRNLGSSCEIKDILDAYNQQRGSIDALENTYYNLGSPSRAFTWENGCLCIKDRYNFEGLGDFGGASLKTLIPGFILGFPGTAAVVINSLLRGLSGDEPPETDPFTIFKRDYPQIGSAIPIYIKNCFCPDDLDENGDPLLCTANEELYRSAINCGIIEPNISNACFNGDSCIEVGAAQPSPILGFPSYAPYATEIITNGVDFTFGGGGNYPRPFTSFTQRIVEANNALGPFAKLGNISGRLITIPSGLGQGELGFACQNWYNFNDGSYALDGDGNLYPSKAEWWDTCIKTRVSARFLPFSSRPFVDVEVAAESFTDNNSTDVYSTDYPMATAALGSITIPIIFASLPSSLLILI